MRWFDTETRSAKILQMALIHKALGYGSADSACAACDDYRFTFDI